MNALIALLQTVTPEPAFCTRLTIALAHLLWQGLAIAALSLAAGLLLRRRSANLRYAFHVAALVLLALFLPVTYCLVEAPSADEIGRQFVAAPEFADTGTGSFGTMPVANQLTMDGEVVPAVNQNDPRAESPALVAAPVRSDVGTARVAPQLDRRWQQLMELAAPYATGLYFLGVLVMSLRLMLGLWGGHRLRHLASPVLEPAVLEAVRRQARQIGLRFVPVVAWCRRVSTPVVVGIVTPAILLPASLAGGLTPEQLAALFTHELAHIRRFDLVVNLLQRVVETLLFFHPAVWYLSRQISRERENCCDDCVLAAGWQGTDYAEALLRMAELCFNGRPKAANLAVLGAAGERPSEFKRRILRVLKLETASTIRLSRAGLISLGLMLILALAGPPLIRRQVVAQSDRLEQVENTQNDFADADEQSATSDRPGQPGVIGQVIDHAGNPVSEAVVFLVTKSGASVIIGQGKTWSQQGDGLVEDKEFPRVITGEDGTFEFPVIWTDATYLAVSAKTVDAWVLTPDDVLNQHRASKAGSETLLPLTKRERAELLMKLAGGPVAVKIRLPQPGRLRVRYDIPAAAESTTVWVHRKLDERKWWPPFAPIRAIPLKNGAALDIDDLAPGRYFVSRNFWDERGIHYRDGGVITIESGDRLEKNFVRKRGTSLAGIVSGPPEMPLNQLERISVRVSPEHATGDLSNDELFNDAFDWVQVNSSGQFRTERLEPGTYTLVATANRRRLEVDSGKSGSSDTEFVGVAKYILPEAGTIPEARIELRKRNLVQFAGRDPEPKPEKEKPADRPGLHVHGRVLDAATGKPVEECRVIPTSVYDEKGRQFTWQPQYRKAFKDGNYEWKTDRPWEMTRLRIEAPGYRPAVSRVIKRGEGNVQIDYRLTPDEGITGVVLTPDGKPAPDAQLAIATWTFEVTVQDGELRQRGHAADLGVKVVYADEEGRFRLPPEVDPAVIVVAHESGYAEVDAPGAQPLPEAKVDGDNDAAGAAKTQNLEIKLLRWGRVEGWVRAGDKPVEGAKFGVGSGYSKRSDLVNIHASDEATSDADGRFAVERVPPGRGWCQRYVPDAKGTGSVGISGLDVQFDLPPGECIPLEIGGKGRTVVGKIRPPAGFAKKIDWSKVTLNIFPRAPHIGFGGDNAMWSAWSTFLKTDEGKPYVREGVAIAADGSFRIEGLPAADYQVVISVPGAAVAEEAQPKAKVAHGGGAFKISPVRADGDDKPLDAGVFQLVVPPQPKKADKDNGAAQLFEPIEGEIVDADTGKPIVGATVVFRFKRTRRAATEPEVVKELKYADLATNRFLFTLDDHLLEHDDLFVERTAWHPDYQTISPSGQSLSRILGNEPAHVRDFIRTVELKPGKVVTGHVVDLNGQPARGIKVVAGRNRRGWENGCRHETITDETGRFRLVVPSDGRGRIYLDPQHAAAVSRAITTGFGEQEVFRLRRGTRITGQITMANGAPAAAVTVRADGGERIPYRYAVTDDNGDYELPPLPAGKYHVIPIDPVVASPSARAVRLPAVFLGRTVLLAKDAPAETVDFEPCATVRISARFVDTSGKPLSNHGFSIHGAAPDATQGAWSGSARRDDDLGGVYSIDVPRGLSFARMELRGYYNNSGLVLAKLQRGPDGPLIPDHHDVYLGTIDRDDDRFIIHYCQAAKLKFTLREAADKGAVENKRAPLDFEAYYPAHSQPSPGRRAQAYSSLIYDSRRLEFDTHPDEDIAFEIRRPGFKPFREMFRLEPGEIREVDVDFEPVNTPGDRDPKDSEKDPKGAGAVIENGSPGVSLKLERREFLLGESIAVEYELANSGKRPVEYHPGGYFPDLRWNDGFRISAVRIDENGKPIGKPVANWPAPENHGGKSGHFEVAPGKRWSATLFVTRVVRFTEPGRYRLRVENINRLDGQTVYSTGETSLTLTAPTRDQAEDVFRKMKLAPREVYDGNAMTFLADAADFETMHQPVYLPVLRDFALKGDIDALPSLERMESPEGNGALVAALSRALDGDDLVVARACYRHLQASLPFPNWYDEGRGDYEKPRRERSDRTWKAEFVPTLARLARRLIPEVAFQIRTMGDTPQLLQKSAQPLLGEIDYIYRCVGRPEDFVDCMKAYGQSIELTKTLPLETQQYFRPRGSAFGFGHAIFRMMQRGAQAPTKPAHPGESATFAIALRSQKDFRPAGWEAEMMKWLKAGPPYLAEVILDHLPEPIPDAVLDWLPQALASDYIDLAIAGCKIAEKHPRAAYKAPLQKLVETAGEQYLVKFSRAAAKANGVEVGNATEE